jgi:hypothetical protein
MLKQIKFLGVTGARRCGKDTFVSLLSSINKRFQRVAFADALKEDLAELFRKQFNVDIHTIDGQMKETLRPILISYGCVWRELDPLHWVKIAENKIKDDAIPCMVDIRFSNEALYFKNKYPENFLLVSIDRIGGPDPTDEERKHMPELEKLSDVKLVWKTDPSLESLLPQVEYFYSKYFLGHE